jgi:hypothetical protein
MRGSRHLPDDCADRGGRFQVASIDTRADDLHGVKTCRVIAKAGLARDEQVRAAGKSARDGHCHLALARGRLLAGQGSEDFRRGAEVSSGDFQDVANARGRNRRWLRRR